MKTKNKIFVLFILLELCTFVFLHNVYADNNICKLSITPNKNEACQGDSIMLKLNVSDINFKDGIAIYNGLIDYDSNAFELSIQDNSSGTWKGDLIENSITFVKADLESTNENQEIGTIVLKVKSGTQLGKYTITLKNNEFANNSSFKIEDVNTSIQIVNDIEQNNSEQDNKGQNNSEQDNKGQNNSEQDNKGQGNSEQDNKGQGNSEQDNNEQNNNAQNKNDSYSKYDSNKVNNKIFIVDQKNNQVEGNSINKAKLPYVGTGSMYFTIIFTAIILTLIFAIYCYKKYQKYHKI